MLVAVKAFYAAAKKVGLIGINPAAELEAPSIGSNSEALLHYYTPQQMNEIVHVFDEDTNLASFRISIGRCNHNCTVL